jgi:hypothetical protein
MLMVTDRHHRFIFPSRIKLRQTKFIKLVVSDFDTLRGCQINEAMRYCGLLESRIP